MGFGTGVGSGLVTRAFLGSRVGFASVGSTSTASALRFLAEADAVGVAEFCNLRALFDGASLERLCLPDPVAFTALFLGAAGAFVLACLLFAAVAFLVAVTFSEVAGLEVRVDSRVLLLGGMIAKISDCEKNIGEKKGIQRNLEGNKQE